MKDKESVFIVNGKEYKAVFNLNVMQEIQNEYGTFTKWGELTDGFDYDDNHEKIPMLDKEGKIVTQKLKDENGKEIEMTVYKTREIDIKALIFGLKAMINEAIDIDNDNKEEKQTFLNEKQVGRLITAMGLKEATNKLNQTVIDSTKSDKEKNV